MEVELTLFRGSLRSEGWEWLSPETEKRFLNFWETELLRCTLRLCSESDSPFVDATDELEDAEVIGCNIGGWGWLLLKEDTGFIDGELDGVGELDFEVGTAVVLFDSFLNRGMVQVQVQVQVQLFLL